MSQVMSRYGPFYHATHTEIILGKPYHGPLTRYTKLRAVHASGMPETIPRHRGLAIPTCIRASDFARAVMHVGIAN